MMVLNKDALEELLLGGMAHLRTKLLLAGKHRSLEVLVVLEPLERAVLTLRCSHIDLVLAVLKRLELLSLMEHLLLILNSDSTTRTFNMLSMQQIVPGPILGEHTLGKLARVVNLRILRHLLMGLELLLLVSILDLLVGHGLGDVALVASPPFLLLLGVRLLDEVALLLHLGGRQVVLLLMMRVIRPSAHGRGASSNHSSIATGLARLDAFVCWGGALGDGVGRVVGVALEDLGVVVTLLSGEDFRNLLSCRLGTARVDNINEGGVDRDDLTRLVIIHSRCVLLVEDHSIPPLRRSRMTHTLVERLVVRRGGHVLLLVLVRVLMSTLLGDLRHLLRRRASILLLYSLYNFGVVRRHGPRLELTCRGDSTAWHAVLVRSLHLLGHLLCVRQFHDWVRVCSALELL
jgi:hypothetical protein